jgi:preprotein translocase subunit SecA
MFKSIADSLKKIFGSKQDRDVAGYAPVVEEINEFAASYRSLSHDELRHLTLNFRKRIAEHLSEIDEEIDKLREEAAAAEDLAEKEDIFAAIDKLKKQRDEELEIILRELLPEAFAVVKETARRFTENAVIRVTATEHDRELAARAGKPYVRIEGDEAVWQNRWNAAGAEIVWNMIHYDVQLIGGMVLHDGKIAEMATGEGKTLVATLPAYLNGLSGQGVHVVTVNDYLARRDSEWIGPIFEFLLLTIDCIDKYRPHSPERMRAYRADITYGTNNEFGFDYLRDNMVRSVDEIVQRKHHYAMVDEVDSVLVDDARTPLIISGPVSQGADDQEYIELKPHVERLMNAQRKLATEFLTTARKAIQDGNTGVQEGEGGMALLRAHRALPKYRPLIKFLSEEGIRVVLQKTENHYMQEQSKNMHLVDEELLFTIDEKNRQVELTEKGTELLAKGNEDPNFFVLPDIATRMVEIDADATLSAMDKNDAKNRLAQDFAVKSKRLHAISQLLKAYTLFERDDDYIVTEEGEVKIVDEQTGRMMEGRRYSDGLHQALEAKENVKVGDITQTYATVTLQNYFRMYHKLAGMTGTAETEAGEFWEIYKLDVVVIPTNKPIVRDDREDLIFKTEREKFNAVSEEVVALSKAGRPVLVGTTSVEISEKLSRMLKLKGIDHNVLNAKQHQREAEIVAEAGKPGKVTIATNMAGRGTDIKISEEVRKAGGLAIIGTERHESRRIDRQLRGRAGRQGDPGTSQFYVSLEDRLMRLFGSERMASWMDKLGHQEGEVIQHSMVTKSIERAQKKVEENNFGIRKRLLEYDDVMNIQREAIYKKRRNALYGERLSVDINNMFFTLVESIVFNSKQQGSIELLKRGMLETMGYVPELDEQQFRTAQAEALADEVLHQFQQFYQHKFSQIIDMVMPQIKDVHATQSHRYKRILLPFTDGSSHPLPISADLSKAVQTNGRSIIQDVEQVVTLLIIDDKWKEHLRNMDELKESVQAASFEQKDPLVVYKMEAYNLFEQLVMEINQEVTAYLSKCNIAVQAEERQIRQAREVKTDMSKSQLHHGQEEERRAAEAVSQAARQETIRRMEAKVGRNDLCPCGSGKKFKHCHGR